MTSETVDGETVALERRGATAWLILNRPQALNSIDPGMVERLDDLLDDIEEDKETRSAVITGTGRAFCVGADLKGARERAAKADGAGTGADRFIASINRLLDRLEQFRKPVIAAINGMTMGAGLELALCADIIVASDAAKIADGHARFGLLPGGGSSARLPRRIGTAAAKWMLFSGEFQPLDRLLAWGLVQAVYPESSFESDVGSLCDQFNARSPLGLARLKSLANDALSGSLAEALDNERAMFKIHMASKDRAEGLAAFSEKRKPNFTGE